MMSIPHLTEHVAGVARKEGLFASGDTVIVALSGGADSTALLDILAGLPDLKPCLVAAHLNHCLRGGESDADEEFSRSLAQKYGIAFESRRVDITELARQERLNLEDAGRRARIAFLDEIRAKHQAKAIALAHHADDQAETVLMRLLRGSGASGLSGMPYRNGRGYIRPLLHVTRSGIESYLLQRGLAWREDASNRDTTFLRNRIRHELLPMLASYNPAIRECLSATADLLSGENDLLEQLATESASHSCIFGYSTVSCSLAALAKQPAALRRRVLRLALKHLTGDLRCFSSGHMESIERLITSERPNASLNLPRKVIALREYDILTLRLASATSAPEIGETGIDGPGCYTLPDGGSLVIKTIAALPGSASVPAGMFFFDLGKAPFPWHVRAFKAGDRLAPQGMAGTKKVKDLFIDAKIPLTKRRQIPLVFSNNTLIWVCGLRASSKAVVDVSSSSIVTAIFQKP